MYGWCRLGLSSGFEVFLGCAADKLWTWTCSPQRIMAGALLTRTSRPCYWKGFMLLEFSANSCETWAQSTFRDRGAPALLIIVPLLQLLSVSSCPRILPSQHPNILPLIWRHYGGNRDLGHNKWAKGTKRQRQLPHKELDKNPLGGSRASDQDH